MNALVMKVCSRKFLLSLAAFLAAFFGGVTGVIKPELCAIGMALSAGIYAACEAYIDGQSVKATTKNVSVTATSTDKETVKKIAEN